MTTSTLEIPSLEGKVSPEEWAVRVDLAAAYRLVALFGWEDLVFTHISARVPGTEDQFLINPYGVFFDEITASSLVKIDLNGDKVEESPFPVNAAGFIIHSAVHGARHDARCVLHTHTLNGVAVSAQRDGLLPLGENVAEAFVRMYYLEAACAIQVRAQSGGGELIHIDKSVIDRGYSAAMQEQRRRNGGQHRLAWPGLLRRLDRRDPSYRH